MDLPELGTTFESKYLLQEILGEGGFATVFEAQDVGAQRTVALKILKPNDEQGYGRDTESRFHREVRVIANLRDPHTITMFDFGRSATGLLFMVFEYVPGMDLSELLEARGPLGDEATIHIMRQVLSSLREAHSAGLLHRDLKPANIRIYEYMGDPLRVTVLDFGIAKPVNPSEEESVITHSGSLVGTPQYMSPEQLLEKQLTPASDIYSLGLVVYEMLTGATAIKGNSLSDQLHVLAGNEGLSLPPDAQVSPGLRRIVDRMISRDPATRLQTAEQVLRSLEAMLRGESTAEVPVQRAPGSQPLLAPGAPGSGPHPGRPPSGVSARHPSTDSMDRWTPPSTDRRSAAIPMREVASGGEAELSTPALLGALFVVLACLALVIYAGAKLLGGPEEARPVVLPPELATVADRPADKPTPPTAAVSAASVDLGSLPDTGGQVAAGCAAAGAPFLGKGVLESKTDLERSSLVVYIPKGYEQGVKHSLLVAFHDAQQSPREAIDRFDLPVLADEHNIVVVAPASPNIEAWQKPDELRRVHADVQIVFDRLCIDETRILGFGHGAGGRGAVRMPCEFPNVRAIATTSFRTVPNEPLCILNSPVPYLQIAMLKDKASPPDGSAGCGGSSNISLQDYEDFFIHGYDCAAKRRAWKKHDTGVCHSFTCGRGGFRSCHVKGGREWPGPARSSPNPIIQIGMFTQCDGKPAKFPFLETIGEFFNDVGEL